MSKIKTLVNTDNVDKALDFTIKAGVVAWIIRFVYRDK